LTSSSHSGFRAVFEQEGGKRSISTAGAGNQKGKNVRQDEPLAKITERNSKATAKTRRAQTASKKQWSFVNGHLSFKKPSLRLGWFLK
jgi:hypothetical protein